MSIMDIRKLIEKNFDKFKDVSEHIFEYAELGNEEIRSKNLLVDELKSNGFKVFENYGGLPTAIRAEYGTGRPKICFMAEYDALPGYGIGKDENAHACGHNFIAANAVGASIVLADILKSQSLNGTIVLMGCPAEETIGGKVNLVNAGCFDDIDVAVQVHLAGGKITSLAKQSLAIDSIEFSYYGVASHAASNPEKGVNALDACILMFNGVNALRQHIKDSSRIHGTISYGGGAPNVVPAFAQSTFMVRATDRKYLNELTKKVISCANGAAEMTGARMEWRYYENSYDNMKLYPVLIDTFKDSLEIAGVGDITTEPEAPLFSTDIGNVSWKCPTVMCNLAVKNSDEYDIHQEEFLPYCHGAKNSDALYNAIFSQVHFAFRILTNQNLRAQIYAAKSKLEHTINSHSISL